MDNHNEDTTPIVPIHYNLEMGSLDGRAVIEFEDESLVSPAAASVSTNKNSFHEITHISAATSAKGYKQYMRNSVIDSIKIVIFSAKINILMPLGPLAILVDKMSGSHGWVFFLSLLGIIPLAERLGYATEQLACFTGPIVGGLLNATFGNITELIISIYALKSGMIRVVQQSLLGSILSNMLLVLGCAFFSGGIVFYEKEQVFDKATASVDSGLLLMAVMGLLFPAVLHSTHTELHFGKSELALSRFSSCIMLVAYASYLAYQLKRQKNQYIPVDGGETQTEEGSDDEEAPEISMWESIIWLSILTAWVSFLSEYLVNAIEGASASLKIPVAFISVILLPIVGNAAEHAGAIMFAMKDKLDISLGVAIGSSTQIAMFGIPFCVVAGWVMGRPMDLNFQLFETATLFITVLVVAFMVQDGTSNYLKGLMLVLCYLIVAASFFVHIDPSSIADKPPKPSH
nr:vacuolar cation/proton exchanger 3-like isoform X1 [Quercus suber]POE95350.1 vacuolar cation/proton exchanger 2 [Quercus suber]